MMIPSKWTESAIDCYNRGCNCTGCNQLKFMDSVCHMRQAVFELVRKFGKPKKNENLVPGLTQKQNAIVNAILDGYTTKQEIAERLRTKPHNIQVELPRIYLCVEAMGYVFRKRYQRLDELVDFLLDIEGKERYEV